MSDQKNPKNGSGNRKKKTIVDAFSFATEFGFAIALPLVGLGLLGKWLDSRWHTKYMVLIAIAIAIVITTIWISIRIRTIFEEYKSKNIEK